MVAHLVRKYNYLTPFLRLRMMLSVVLEGTPSQRLVSMVNQ